MLLKNKTILSTIKIINIFGWPFADAKVELVRIDAYFHRTQKKFESITDKFGIINFKVILDGTYLVKISKKNFNFETVTLLRLENKIILPTMLGLFGNFKVSNYKIDNLYETLREDREYCFKCKAKYRSCVDKFLCHYCKNYFCDKHRVAENHSCPENLNSLPGTRLREIHTKHGIEIRTD